MATSPDDFITVTEAREILGITAQKIANLIRDGVLTAHTTPLNGRVKLIRRQEVEALLTQYPQVPPSKKNREEDD